MCFYRVFTSFVTEKVIALFVLTIGQTVIYTIIYEPKFLLRHMAMMGALMILLAEHQGIVRKMLKLFDIGT